ncbi:MULTISPECIES: ArsR family transcriptional regulator [unclassified Cupriavidus]|jgi:ArsR family transcriptional regulator|uniref:ArsR family transcriptional regulator n=1 Tax=unclassified Cupriavidus TaxID=2640874 RepID=UPI001BFFE7E9|nr:MULTISPECIES: ArsR family transcriptional regulator [unclassified Cupriavidus]MCA3187582.1 ArsR family transcriptional regulator [Cupriavidus sp.]MCA3192941.1 ArsR family transcriptional regulator [Cupriavidus sp.]MCA3195793.1 ArsR family transcriptional regulator [Cupriavidus sp.]MCA3204694.1 ArsR family transcriptional regulator [Cupriavidus sp.]MCA3206826.1 ArsR family transcriptional regulator [Cupriavidus sp.]
METQESTLTLALLTVPARAAICRALLEAGDECLPAIALVEASGVTMRRAAHHFQEMVQAEVLALVIRDHQVCYTLKARRAVREALEFVDRSGLN